jgi:hypothetical protein
MFLTTPLAMMNPGGTMNMLSNTSADTPVLPLLLDDGIDGPIDLTSSDLTEPP